MVSTELTEPGNGSRGEHCPPELSGMFAFTEAGAFCCRLDRVASVKISSHLSFDLSNGDIALLFQDRC